MMKIVIFGYGRWSKIYVKEILKNFKKINLLIYSSLNQKINHKNISFIKKKKLISNIKAKYFLVLNSTKDHKASINNIANHNCKILVEKPLTNSPLDFFELKNKNIFLGLQYSYSKYFLYLKKLLKTNNEKIKYIKLIWTDSYLEKKKYNNKIKFIEDIYYHFYSIIRIFFLKKNLKKKRIFEIKKNQILIDFKFNSKASLNVKIGLRKRRILKIYTKKNIYVVNFLKLDEVNVYKNKNIIKSFHKNNKNLIKQLNYFLKSSKNIKQNSLSNLGGLFNDLLIINKKLK
jgi:hypothetical protein